MTLAIRSIMYPILHFAAWVSLLCLLCDTAIGQGEAQKAPGADHWAYQPIGAPRVPQTHATAWSRNSIDAFILHRLRASDLQPSPEADRRTLIRRLSLDLIGLPPTLEEVDRFVNDRRLDAYEQVVDRLLSSPHYGERWGRLWMDLCHYGDTDGYLTDQLRPYAWRYRDWLVNALNQDLAFDQFTIQQLAGDLLPNATVAQKTATGFLRQTLSNREGGAEPEEFRVLQVVNRTELVGAVWLGTTIGCARCHDHFYDPISQREFFELYACFNNADEINIDSPLPGEEGPFAAAYSNYLNQRSAVIEPVRKPLESLQKKWEGKLLDAYREPGRDAHWDRQWELLGLVWGRDLGEGQLEGAEIVKRPWKDRTRREHDDLLDYFLHSSGDVDRDEWKRLDLSQVRDKLDALKKNLPPMARAPAMRAAKTRRETHVHVRGDFRQPGESVAPAAPRALLHRHRDASLTPRNGARLGDERLELARWLVADDHPLTARVSVNRMWQEFFGVGLVATPDDFGKHGSPPSHPMLLDHLAAEFVRLDWSVKAMHRLIVTSATYRQSSRRRREPKLEAIDPSNRLWARQNSLRLPAEAIRDAALAASGTLCRRMGGPSIKPPQPSRVVMEAFDNKTWAPSEGGDRYRRGVYIYTIRTAPFAQAAIFDAPNPNQICTRRERSNTPIQALTMLNDEVFVSAARSLAALVIQLDPGNSQESPRSKGHAPPTVNSVEQRIEWAFRRCLLRRPTEEERRVLRSALETQIQEFIRDPRAAKEMVTGVRMNPDAVVEVDPAQVQWAAWTVLCSALLNVHEFITRD